LPLGLSSALAEAIITAMIAATLQCEAVIQLFQGEVIENCRWMILEGRSLYYSLRQSTISNDNRRSN
jgi:hypothetical protein